LSALDSGWRAAASWRWTGRVAYRSRSRRPAVGAARDAVIHASKLPVIVAPIRVLGHWTSWRFSA